MLCLSIVATYMARSREIVIIYFVYLKSIGSLCFIWAFLTTPSNRDRFMASLSISSPSTVTIRYVVSWENVRVVRPSFTVIGSDSLVFRGTNLNPQRPIVSCVKDRNCYLILLEEETCYESSELDADATIVKWFVTTSTTPLSSLWLGSPGINL